MPINSPKIYSEKIDTYESQFPAALDDFKKYYVFFNKNPESTEYKNSFDNIVSQIQNIVRGVNSVTDTIQNDVSIVNNTIQYYNSKMTTERKLSTEFNNVTSSVADSANGSKTRIDDYVGLYNKQYILNIEICVGILLAILVLLKVFQGQKSKDYNIGVWIILLLLIVLVYWVLLKITTYFFPFKPLNL